LGAGAGACGEQTLAVGAFGVRPAEGGGQGLESGRAPAVAGAALAANTATSRGLAALGILRAAGVACRDATLAVGALRVRRAAVEIVRASCRDSAAVAGAALAANTATSRGRAAVGILGQAGD